MEVPAVSQWYRFVSAYTMTCWFKLPRISSAHFVPTSTRDHKQSHVSWDTESYVGMVMFNQIAHHTRTKSNNIRFTTRLSTPIVCNCVYRQRIHAVDTMLVRTLYVQIHLPLARTRNTYVVCPHHSGWIWHGWLYIKDLMQSCVYRSHVQSNELIPSKLGGCCGNNN